MHARGNATRMRVATNRAGILLAIMRPGQLKSGFDPYSVFICFKCSPMGEFDKN